MIKLNLMLCEPSGKQTPSAEKHAHQLGVFNLLIKLPLLVSQTTKFVILLSIYICDYAPSHYFSLRKVYWSSTKGGLICLYRLPLLVSQTTEFVIYYLFLSVTSHRHINVSLRFTNFINNHYLTMML